MRFNNNDQIEARCIYQLRLRRTLQWDSWDDEVTLCTKLWKRVHTYKPGMYIVRVIITLCKPNDNIIYDLRSFIFVSFCLLLFIKICLCGAFFVLLCVAHVRKMMVRVYLYGVYNAASSYKIYYQEFTIQYQYYCNILLGYCHWSIKLLQ